MVNSYIEQLVIDIDIDEEFKTDNEHEYKLQLDKNIFVTITDLRPGFIFKSPIAEISTSNCEDLVTKLMTANLFYQGTEFASIGLDSKGRQLSLSKVISLNMEYDEFKDCLENFVNVVDFWQRETKKYISTHATKNILG